MNNFPVDFRRRPPVIQQEAIVLPEGDLRAVLMRACAQRGVFGPQRVYWVNKMMEVFENAEVETVRDFLEGYWSVNSRLRCYGCGDITPSTIKLLLRLCCDALFAAGERAGRAEAMQAVRASLPAGSGSGSASASVASLESGEVASDDGRVIAEVEGDPDWYPERDRERHMVGPFAVLDESEDDTVVADREVRINIARRNNQRP